MNINYIELRGEKHPLCYNLYAIERICDEFGDIEAMSRMVSSDKQTDQIRAVSKLLKILMEGGREYCREMGMELPKEVKNPSALIDIASPETIKAVFGAINGNSARTVEATSKNAEATRGEA